MDYSKIGELIKKERKLKSWTQTELADKLCVSEKTVSKWENGNGVPDTDTLPKLCELFDISLVELLNGERTAEENYKEKAEDQLLDLQKRKEELDKQLLAAEISIGSMATVVTTSLVMIASLIEMHTGLRVGLIGLGAATGLSGILIALKIEQLAGYYHCEKCDTKYIPKYSKMMMAPHKGRTRKMTCPCCKEKSWQKKVIK